MRIPFLGVDLRLTPIRRQKAVGSGGLQAIGNRGWWPIIREPFTGAWQRNIEHRSADVLTFCTVWACITLIASDIAKLWIELLEQDAKGIRTPTTSSAFSPVLRKPNRYQTRVKFIEHWMISKLVHGNTYTLKERDRSGIVRALYILDPTRVQMLISPDGSLFYKLAPDNLAGIHESDIIVPAREIIHDIMVPLYHPLIGVSPIHACWKAASQGLKIQDNSSTLFDSGTTLSGVLSTPHPLPADIAETLQKNWAANFQGQDNIGKVAIVGDDFKFTPMTMTAVDAQLIDQLKWNSEAVCACFHVPGYMVGIGPPPPYTDIQSINLQYYNQALQNPIENLETLLDEGLELPTAPRELHVEFDLSALARMDSRTQTAVMRDRIGAGFMTPNEARAELDMKPVEGGDVCYLQQQNFSLQALSRRDEAGPAPLVPGPGSVAPASDTPTGEGAAADKALVLEFQMKAKALGLPVFKEAA